MCVSIYRYVQDKAIIRDERNEEEEEEEMRKEHILIIDSPRR